MDAQNSPHAVVIPPQIRVFLESILVDANMHFWDEQMYEEALQELYVVFDKFMASVIAENLPPEHLDAFIALNESPTTANKAEEFLKTHLPNAAEVMTLAFADFRERYLRNLAARRNVSEEIEQTTKGGQN